MKNMWMMNAGLPLVADVDNMNNTLHAPVLLQQ
jgi:hypothetical protein